MISVGINVGYVPRVVVEGTGNDPSGRDCIEHISIEVHPDADDLGSGQLLDGAMDYFACAAFANLGEIDNRNLGYFNAPGTGAHEVGCHGKIRSGRLGWVARPITHVCTSSDQDTVA